MGAKIYKSSSVEKCIELASLELEIPLNEVQYSIIEDKKILFKRVVSISVDFDENSEATEGDEVLQEGQGSVRVEDGKIIIKDPIEGKEPAIIIPTKSIRIMVDGLEITAKKQVFQHNIIELIFDENAVARNMNIAISEDKFEAFVTISYSPQINYGLKDTIEAHSIAFEAEVKEKIMPPIYNIDEIKEQLKANEIVYGILVENLEKCTNPDGVENLIVAQGIVAVDDEDDRVKIKVDTDTEAKHLQADQNGKVDFKSIGFVSGVKPGDVLAVIYKGKDGQDGIDVFGKAKVHKKGLRVKITAGDGCAVKEENTIVATLEGKPCMKGNTFFVYKVHNLQGDVDIKSGDIKFVGDVNISGNVKEGMKVEAGNSITVLKNVERATIAATGNIAISGNVITSTITAGGHDVKNLKQMENMKNLKNQLTSLSETVVQIKKFNLLGNDVQDGEAIKVLIENKFKQIPKTCIDIMVSANPDRGDHESSLIILIKTKLMGLGPLSIKNYGEIDEILKITDANIEELNSSLALPVNIKLPYCQECTVNSSGDIFFTGNGEYVSNITANGNIYFESSQSVARGGEIKAKNEIKCKKVGSTGGVSTKLIVEKEGHIWADVAYQNTQLVIGLRKHDIEYPSKDLHAFLNEKGEIVVESLKL